MGAEHPKWVLGQLWWVFGLPKWVLGIRGGCAGCPQAPSIPPPRLLPTEHVVSLLGAAHPQRSASPLRAQNLL